MTRSCAICGCESAPYGYRWPGLIGDAPEDKRGRYLWVCRDHIPDAEQRMARATGRDTWRSVGEVAEKIVKEAGE